MDIRIVVTDDDNASRTILKHFIERIPGFKIVDEATNGEEFLESLVTYRPDLALVDITMPGINGVEAVKMAKDMHPFLQVIFTTGYNEFAVEAFNLSAVDYLVKPIELPRLILALERAKKTLSQLKVPLKNLTQEKIPIKSQNALIYLVVDDILFIEVELRKTIVHTLKNRYETTESLQEYGEKLPNYFFRTHRSYLVNLRKISRIEASGETFLAYFANYEKSAHISKLKIQEVQSMLVN